MLDGPALFARQVAQDSRLAVRQWARRPFSTGFAILALAIGAGANTGIFSVVNALLLRSLPFRDPERLAAPLYYPQLQMTRKQFHEWPSQTSYLEDAATFDHGEANFGGTEEALRVHLTETSSNFFSLLGTQPTLGRVFAPDEDTPGRDHVAIIGDGLWREVFAGDSKALGSTIRLDGAPITIIGVMPPGFNYPDETAVWVPTTFDRLVSERSPFLGGEVLRLKAGVGWVQANAAFVADQTRLARDRVNLAHPPSLVPLSDALAGSVKGASLILMTAVALILLIACANVANLLLARTAERANEMSIRSALGATPARLSRQLLTESLLLSLVSSYVGFIVAYATVFIASKVQPAPLADQRYSILDARVLLFAIAMSVVCGLLFGTLPALYARGAHRFLARGSSARGGSGAVRQALIAVQAMLTIVLLVSSLSLVRAFAGLLGMDRGFNRAGVVTMRVSLAGTVHDSSDGKLQYFQESLRRVRQVPGVRDASVTEFLPLAFTPHLGGPFTLDGRRGHAMVIPVLPDYFRTMGGQIVYGRDIRDSDVQSDSPVAVVNDLLAKEFGGPAAIVGHQIQARPKPITIVGVVRHMVYFGDSDAPQIYEPDRTPGQFFGTIVARVELDDAGRPENRLVTIRDAVKSVDPRIAIYEVKTLNQLFDEGLLRPKVYSATVLFLAGFALLLALIGIYGVVSYTVEQRTHEMGVRLALGSTPPRLRGVMLRQALITIICGAVPGVVGAILAGRFLQSLIDGAKPAGIGLCGAAFLLIATTAAAACWMATRRVARLDIIEVLRAE